MAYLAAFAAAVLALQDATEQRIQAATEAATVAADRVRRDFQMALVELGPDAIPSLEKRLEGPDRELVKQAIDEIKRLKDPIEKLMKQLEAEDVTTRDLAALDLLKLGRPAWSYLGKAMVDERRGDLASRARVILSQQNAKPHPIAIELDLLMKRERVEIQALRLKVLEIEQARGSVPTLKLIQARKDLEKNRYESGITTREAYLQAMRVLVSQELEGVELEAARGKATAKDVLKVRLQLLYLDRRLGKEVEAQIREALQEASRLIRAESGMAIGRPVPQLKLLLDFAKDELD